jgi:hypothetical protein
MGRHGGHQPPPKQAQPQGQYPPPGPYSLQEQHGPPPRSQYASAYTGYQQTPYGQLPYDAGPQYQAPGPHYPYIAPPQTKRRHWVRNTLLVVGGLVILVVVAAVVKTAGGASAVTVNGTVTPSSGASSVFGSGITATTYAECALASPKPGTQITITSPSGQVIGTGTLGLWADSSVTASGVTVYQCDMPFIIKNVPSESRYGFSVNGVPGTIWETSVSGPVNLSINSGSS